MPHHSLTGKHFFFIYNLNLLFFSLKPVPLVLSPHTLVKSFPSFFAPFRCWKTALRYPQSLLFSILDHPNSLRLFSQETCSSCLIIFCLSSRLCPSGPCSSSVGSPRAGCMPQGRVSEGQNHPLSVNLLTAALWLQPRIELVSGLCVHIASSC